MKKLLITFIIMLLILTTCVNISLGVDEESADLVLKPSSTEVAQGSQDFTLTIAYNNINSNYGLCSFVAKIEYDKDVFNEIDVDDITALSVWKTINYSDTTKRIAVLGEREITSNTDFAVIKFTVKDDAKLGATTIAFNNIRAGAAVNNVDAAKDIPSEDVSKTINIVAKQSGGNTGSQGGNGSQGGTTETKQKPQVLDVKYDTVSNGVKVTVTTDKILKTMTGWELSQDKKSISKVYTSDFKGTVQVEDTDGLKSDAISLDVKMPPASDTKTDTTKPTATVKYTKNTNGKVTITVTGSEELAPVTGWTLSADKKVLTKEVAENYTEALVITDLAGNKSETISVKADTTKPTVTISSTKDTSGKVTVKITSNEELEPVTGWTLSADKKVLTKEFNEKYTGKISVSDLAGNKVEVSVDTTATNGGTVITTTDNNSAGTTVGNPSTLPNTGINAIVIPLMVIITIGGAFAFMQYNKMRY